ncbi:MAG: diaminopimelate decarboxylase [Acidobacteriota bacterium]
MTRTTSSRDRHVGTSDTDVGSPSTHPERLSAGVMAAALSRALESGLLDGSDNSLVFYDLSRLESTLDRLSAAFPPTTLHAVAVKANPLVEILKQIRMLGHGAEVASMGELQLALAAGFPIETIVFDSPVKTLGELEVALKMGIRINANSLAELARIDSLYSSLGSRSHVGVRINPETGTGSIDSTSVAVQHSKFGVSLLECRAALTRAFSEYRWLTGLHLHIGSQGMSLEQLLGGVGAVYDFFIELRESAEIRFFNIGGGLPAKYRESDTPAQFKEYATMLRQRCPGLFDPDVFLLTEFGRSVHASCGWVASRIEYLIEHKDSAATLVVHVGADMFLREAYRPDDWHHDISVCDSSGRLRTGPQRMFRVAGPLCFAGDYLDRSVSLPSNVTEGDYVIIHDAGAYSFSMWSMYNSRQFPAIIGYNGGGERFRFLRPRQSLDQIVDFWSGGGKK